MAGLLRGVIDVHTCPQAEGTVPHVGGPVLAPSVMTVFVNGFPVVVKGDVAFCVGRPDAVTAGVRGVKVGGRDVADSRAATEHGGAFPTCSPDVLAG